MNRRSFLTRTALNGFALAGALMTPRIGRAGEPDWALMVGDVEADLPQQKLTRIQGNPPVGLEGTLYRNGPAKFRRPGGDSGHWFDGDGLIRAFALQQGQASLRARFVATRKRESETALQAIVMPGFGTAQKPSARVTGADDANAANTSIIAVGDKLWALWEAGSPIEMAAESLATLGPKTLRADLKGMPFLAHPRIEASGRIWNLGVAADRAIIWLLSRDGSLLSANMISLPRASYIHDFTMTDSHLVLILQPWLQERATTPQNDGFAWRPEQGTQILVLAKSDVTERRIFELPAFFCFHISDGWSEKNGTIRFDACLHQDPSVAGPAGGKLLKGVNAIRETTDLAMIALHPDGSAELNRTGKSAEFPRTDPRFSGQIHRFTAHVGIAHRDKPLYRGLGVQDWQDGVHRSFDFGADQLVEEMVFIPRPGATAEFDGWLVGTSLNLAAKATELHVFDASHIEDGPLCSWRADRPLPVGFHGNFVPT